MDYLVDTDDSLVTGFDWWSRRQPNSSVVGGGVGGADSPARYGPSSCDLVLLFVSTMTYLLVARTDFG